MFGEAVQGPADGDAGGVGRRAAEGGGDGLVAGAGFEAHHQRPPVAGRQRAQAGTEAPPAIAVDGVVERRGPRGGVLVEQRRRDDGPRGAATLVDQAILDHASQVGEERARETQLDERQAAEDVQRRVLHHVVGVGQAAGRPGQPAADAAPQRAFIAGEELAPGGLVAQPGAHHEVDRRCGRGIRSGGWVHQVIIGRWGLASRRTSGILPVSTHRANLAGPERRAGRLRKRTR